MRKLIILLSIIFITIIIYVVVLFIPKDYELDYKIDIYDINEKYNKKLNTYNYIVKYMKEDYPFIIERSYSKTRRLLSDIEVVKDKEDTCLTATIEEKKYTVCRDKTGLKDYRLINEELYKKNFDKIISATHKETFKKIDFYSNELNFMVWNYTGFINYSKGEGKIISLFKKDKYTPVGIYQTEDYLVIPNYDQEYYFKKIYIYNKIGKTEWFDFTYEISYDLLYLGTYKNKLYFIDKKNETEYELNLKKLEINRVKLKNNKVVIYNGKNEELHSYKEVTTKDIKFKTSTIYEYKLIDNKLYQIIDSRNILVSNKKVSNIVSINGNNVYYMINNSLYMYNQESGEKLLATNKEWKFNSTNQIYIFN